MKTKTGAKLLVDCLLKHGVEFIFGIPGAKIDAVFDALIDTPIKIILCRHEQNAAFMASAYGRLTGRPGVVLVTSGPGVSNLATGLLTANTEGDPVIAIGGNVPRDMKLKQSHQSMDNIKLMEAVTKARMEVLVTDNIPEIVENAFRIAATPRSGAVFISFPQDVGKEKTKIEAYSTRADLELNFGTAPNQLINKAIEIINNAKNPAILLGLEASRPDNTNAIRSFLTKTPFPVVGTYQAAGVISHELLKCFVGRVGLFKNQPGDKLLEEADVIITVGYNPVEYDPEFWNKPAKKIIHVNYHYADIDNDYIPQVELLGDIAFNLYELNKELKPNPVFFDRDIVSDFQKEINNKIASGEKYNGSKVHPLRFMFELKKLIDDDTFVISDIGTHYMWIARYLYSYEPRHLLFSNGQQTLGVALPWAMAAKLTHPKNKVISISGDGGFLFSAMELETAVREKLPFVHCVWCDGSYNMVEEQQLLKYHRETAVHFGPVDVVKYAESFGATGFRVKKSNDLYGVLKKAFEIDGPVLIEIPIDYSENKELFTQSHDSLID